MPATARGSRGRLLLALGRPAVCCRLRCVYALTAAPPCLPASAAPCPRHAMCVLQLPPTPAPAIQCGRERHHSTQSVRDLNRPERWFPAGPCSTAWRQVPPSLVPCPPLSIFNMFSSKCIPFHSASSSLLTSQLRFDIYFCGMRVLTRTENPFIFFSVTFLPPRPQQAAAAVSFFLILPPI